MNKIMKLQIKNHPQVFIFFFGVVVIMSHTAVISTTEEISTSSYISIYSNLVIISKVRAIMPRPLPDCLNAGFCCYNIAASSGSCLKFKWHF